MNGRPSSNALLGAIRDFYRPRRVWLVTRMPADQVLEKLKDSVDRSIPLLSLAAGSKPFLGWVRGNKFSIRARNNPLVNNSFRRSFVGTVSERYGQTWVEGRFKMSPFVAVFLGFWFGFLLLFSFGTTAATLGHASCTGTACGSPIFLGIPALMAMIGVALVSLGLGMSIGLERKVKRFLLEDLQLQESELPPPREL